MWLATHEQITALDRAIAEEMRKLGIAEGWIDPETGEFIPPEGEAENG